MAPVPVRTVRHHVRDAKCQSICQPGPFGICRSKIQAGSPRPRGDLLLLFIDRPGPVTQTFLVVSVKTNDRVVIPAARSFTKAFGACLSIKQEERANIARRVCSHFRYSLRQLMRAFVALLIVITVVASAEAQAPVVTGPSVSQGQAGTAGPAWRGYSRGTYSRSAAPTRPSYSQPARRVPSQYQRSTWRPRATYYSKRGYGQQPIPAPAIPTAPGVPTQFGYSRAGGQPQVRQPVANQPPLAASTPNLDKVRQASARSANAGTDGSGKAGTGSKGP